MFFLKPSRVLDLSQSVHFQFDFFFTIDRLSLPPGPRVPGLMRPLRTKILCGGGFSTLVHGSDAFLFSLSSLMAVDAYYQSEHDFRKFSTPDKGKGCTRRAERPIPLAGPCCRALRSHLLQDHRNISFPPPFNLLFPSRIEHFVLKVLLVRPTTRYILNVHVKSPLACREPKFPV